MTTDSVSSSSATANSEAAARAARPEPARTDGGGSRRSPFTRTSSLVLEEGGIPRARPASAELHVDDLEIAFSARGPHADLVSRFLADQRSRQR